MRVGIFTDTYPPYINGVSTSILMLQRALEKQGHQVFIVTVNSDNMKYKYEDDNKIIRIPGIPTGIYDYRLTGIYPFRVLNKIKKWDLDVIHSHTEFGIGTFARIIAKQYNIPLVHTYHTMYEDYVHYITKGYFDGPSKKIVEYLTKFYCDKTATELIVPTKKTYDLFKQKYKIEKNVHIIPTGIEVERFYKEKYDKRDIELLKKTLGFSKDDFIILFVGRIAEEKNIKVLIEAQSNLIKKYKNCKLLIVGDGPDSEKLKKQSIKLDEHVVFTGKIPWDLVPKYYLLSNAFATASTSETQGLTVIEAQASSLVPIVINDESFTSVVIDNLNGLIFRNKKEYIKKVEMLIEDKNMQDRISKQARISSETYSSKYYASRVTDVYKHAIETNGVKKGIINQVKNVIKKGFKS